ncbi:MAG TPA: hypothetical protein VKA53_10060 [Thermoanaerobaculia bacterium]|nr:hypothetical protein [Thermoanaerobaculia bacterium]
MKTEVSPSFDALYYSFYDLGLRRVIGRHSLRYTAKGFPVLGHHGLAFRRASDGARVFISASDGSALNQTALDWCDLYAKINVDSAVTAADPQGGKVVPIGPSFAVRAWAPLGATLLSLARLARGRRLIGDPAEHLKNYVRQWRHRLPEAAYRPGRSQPDYAFFMASLWKKEGAINEARANFLRAARRAPGLTFEGGFAPRAGGDVPGFEDLTAESRLPLKEYVARMKRSVVAFNTPAVSHCLGWKLAEFLALGKAIISTPLARELPAPLEHGRHVHYVDGSEGEVREALEILRRDHAYRAKLEQNARGYYETHLEPEAVIERLLHLPLPLRPAGAREDVRTRVRESGTSG